jgi:hypothetical protein
VYLVGLHIHNTLLIIKIVGLNKKTWILKYKIVGVFVKSEHTHAFKILPVRVIIPF